MKVHEITNCAICNSKQLDMLWDLPKLPFTEKYGVYDPNNNLFCDQQLLFCEHCGHVQLATQIDPEFLYTPTEYAFRTASSKTATEGTQFFYDFFREVSKEKMYFSLMDIGGNGCTLANMVHGTTNKCIVDPVCSDQDGEEIDGVKIIGKFIEQIDFSSELPQPDLIFCRHVLEHIAQPKEVLQLLFTHCHSDALYVFEIPCFENLSEAGRFDAVFHQHYHYFDIHSFKNLLVAAGGEYVSHKYNRQGSCGGALLIAFKKAKASVPVMNRSFLQERKKNYLKELEFFREQMAQIAWRLSAFKGNTYGYGASLMLSTLAYHLKTDLSELVCILDDDPLKDGISYINVPVTVHTPSVISLPDNANYLITSLENVRAIYRHITQTYRPRRILTPIVI